LHDVNPAVPVELSHAVASALALDQLDRPADAMMLAAALRDGVHGIEPPTAATAHIGTRPTRVLLRDAPAEPPTQHARRPRGAAREASAYAEEPRRPGRTGRAFRRFVALLALLLVFVAAVVVAVVIATSSSTTVEHFRTVIAHDAQSALNQLDQLVNGSKK
jgi:hypothetical protein